MADRRHRRKQELGRAPKAPIRGLSILPSLFTIGNIFCAYYSVMATLNGALYGVFPIAWIVFASILLYRIAVETGKFEIIKDSIGGLTDDRRLQALALAARRHFLQGVSVRIWQRVDGQGVATTARDANGLAKPCLIGGHAGVAGYARDDVCAESHGRRRRRLYRLTRGGCHGQQAGNDDDESRERGTHTFCIGWRSGA